MNIDVQGPFPACVFSFSVNYSEGSKQEPGHRIQRDRYLPEAKSNLERVSSVHCSDG